MCPGFAPGPEGWLSGWTTLNPNQTILVLLEATLTNVQGETPSYCIKSNPGTQWADWAASPVSAGTWGSSKVWNRSETRSLSSLEIFLDNQGLSPFISHLRKVSQIVMCVCVCLYHCVSAFVCSSCVCTWYVCVFVSVCMCVCLPICTCHLSSVPSWEPYVSEASFMMLKTFPEHLV